MEKRRTIEDEELRKVFDENRESDLLEAWAFFQKYKGMGIDIERKSKLIDARNKVILRKIEFLKQAFVAADSLDLGINLLRGDEDGK